MKSYLAILSLAAFAVSGCTTHPIVDNVSSDTTFSIYMKIRCEARDAVANAAIDYMLEDERPQITKKAGVKYKQNPALFLHFDPKEVDKETADILSYTKKASFYMILASTSPKRQEPASRSILFGHS